MKKLVYGGVFLAVLVLVLIACSKEHVNMDEVSISKLKNKNDDENSKAKSKLLDDEFLISAIDGNLKEYENLFSLERLLTSESPLSEKVLIHMSAAPVDRVQDYLVELMSILSSPANNKALKTIGENRQNLDINFIRKNIRKRNETKFIKVNLTPRKIIFANSLEMTELNFNDCNDCSKEIRTNKNSRIIELTNFTDIVAPIGGPAYECPSYLICGEASDVRKIEDPRNLPYTVYSVTCENVVQSVCFSTSSQIQIK